MKKMHVICLILVVALVAVIAIAPVHQWQKSIDPDDSEAMLAAALEALDWESAEKIGEAVAEPYRAMLLKNDSYSAVVLFRENELFSQRVEASGWTKADLGHGSCYIMGEMGKELCLFFGCQLDAEEYHYSLSSDTPLETVSILDGNSLELLLWDSERFTTPIMDANHCEGCALMFGA